MPKRKLLTAMRKFLAVWLILMLAAGLIVTAMNIVSDFTDRSVSVTVNFSFDGIESGHDPLGNKFDVNDIRSKSSIKECLDELGISGSDADSIYSAISISGNVPSDVISRITSYTSMYDTEKVEIAKNMKDLTYYPTQYKITMDCAKANELKVSECAKLLNLLSEKYKRTFFDSYGYKKSIENAIISIDHNDYDYADAALVFDSNLLSLKNYIGELEKTDEVRFRSENSGYTFSDLAKSIETLRTEDLEMLSSYITLYSVTKDKKDLISKYSFRIEELERSKKQYEQMLEGLRETIDSYQQNTIMVFDRSDADTDTSFLQSSEAYAELVDKEVAAEKSAEEAAQEINRYRKRIKNLEGSVKKGSEEKVKEDFEKLSSKLDALLTDVRDTVNEYYEEVVLKNAYQIISPASDSTWGVLKNAAKSSVYQIIEVFLIITGVYLLWCVLYILPPTEPLFERIPQYFGRKEKADKKHDKKPKKNGRKK